MSDDKINPVFFNRELVFLFAAVYPACADIVAPSISVGNKKINVLLLFMPQISRFFGISIYMYAKDHFPPHFHAIYGDDEAMIEIRSKKIINGYLSGRAMKLIREWIELHEQELLDNFNETQKANPQIKLIAPLK